MKFEIKNWATGGLLFSIETESWKLAIEAAIKAKADLRSANLRSANLRYANLSSANLRSADLCYADLRYADLSSADLCYADLRYADLSYADLRYANLSSANLSYANLSSANLRYANLKGIKNGELALAQTLIVSEGPMFGWKKCRENVIVKLFIPSKAKRSNANGRKCRAERAKVLEIIGAEKGISIHDSSVIYEPGKWVRCDKWNEDRWEECGGGIHFFISRIEAEAYA